MRRRLPLSEDERAAWAMLVLATARLYACNRAVSPVAEDLEHARLVREALADVGELPAEAIVETGRTRNEPPTGLADSDRLGLAMAMERRARNTLASKFGLDLGDIFDRAEFLFNEGLAEETAKLRTQEAFDAHVDHLLKEKTGC